MKLRQIFLPTALATIAALSPLAAQGRLDVLEHGQYVCALPGDASGAAWVEQSGANFTISSASSYQTRSGNGTYLMEGKRIEFSRGPFKGRSFMLMSSGLLQQIDKNGNLGRLRCHRAGPVPE